MSKESLKEDLITGVEEYEGQIMDVNSFLFCYITQIDNILPLSF